MRDSRSFFMEPYKDVSVKLSSTEIQIALSFTAITMKTSCNSHFKNNLLAVWHIHGWQPALSTFNSYSVDSPCEHSEIRYSPPALLFGPTNSVLETTNINFSQSQQ